MFYNHVLDNKYLNDMIKKLKLKTTVRTRSNDILVLNLFIEVTSYKFFYFIRRDID